MLDDALVADLLDRIDISQLGACSLCLFDAAWKMHDTRPPREVAGAVTTASNWTWWEIEDSLRRELARLRMRGVESAGDALVDLDARGWRSRIVRRIVERLASEMAAEMGRIPVETRHLQPVPDAS
jgi:hypothetical protein